jgi:hypothetical protein
VKSLLEAPGQFGKCRITELHEVLTERANRGTSSVLVIDPRILELGKQFYRSRTTQNGTRPGNPQEGALSRL